MNNEKKRSNLLDIDENAFQNLRMTAEEKQILLDKLERESLYQLLFYHLNLIERYLIISFFK
jgi:hypothetical protein